MAIEIKELIIRYTIEESQNKSASDANRGDKLNYKKLVRDCTESVIDKLSRKDER